MYCIVHLYIVPELSKYTLRPHKINKKHQSDNLPERFGRLGDTEEFNNNVVPEKLPNKGQNNKRQGKCQEYCYRISIDFTLDVGGGIGETFDSCPTGRHNGRHRSRSSISFLALLGPLGNLVGYIQGAES